MLVPSRKHDYLLMETVTLVGKLCQRGINI